MPRILGIRDPSIPTAQRITPLEYSDIVPHVNRRLKHRSGAQRGTHCLTSSMGCFARPIIRLDSSSARRIHDNLRRRLARLEETIRCEEAP